MRGARFEHRGRPYAVLELDPVDPELKLPASITPTERDVIALVLEGLPSAQIAARRGTSPRTIANQLRSIYKKLGVASRTELVLALETRRGS